MLIQGKINLHYHFKHIFTSSSNKNVHVNPPENYLHNAWIKKYQSKWQLEIHSLQFHLYSRWHHRPRWPVGVPACAEREPSEAERWGIHHTRSRRPLQRAGAGTHSQYSGWWVGWLSAWAVMRKKGCQVSLGHPGKCCPACCGGRKPSHLPDKRAAPSVVAEKLCSDQQTDNVAALILHNGKLMCKKPECTDSQPLQVMQ